MIKKILPILLLSGLSFHEIAFADDYKTYNGKEVKVESANFLSGIVIGAGSVLSDKLSDESFLEALKAAKEKNLTLLSGNQALASELEDFKGKLNNYLLTNTLKQKVYFRTAEFNLSQREEDYLSIIIKNIKEHDNLNIKLVGYADPRGDSQYNLNLSKKRVNTVSNLIQELGVPKENIEEYSKGERGSKENKNYEDFFFDRMVEIYISKN